MMPGPAMTTVCVLLEKAVIFRQHCVLCNCINNARQVAQLFGADGHVSQHDGPWQNIAPHLY